MCRVSRFSNITHHLKELHWLPITQRINFKWCLLIFKQVNYGLPPYFSDSFATYTCDRSTRRSAPENKFLRTLPFNRSIHKSKRWFDSSFSVAAPSLWNSLPTYLRTASSVPVRRGLKAYFYNIAYPPIKPP